MAIPARHERLINTVAPKAHFQAERLMFIFLRFQAHGNNPQSPLIRRAGRGPILKINGRRDRGG